MTLLLLLIAKPHIPGPPPSALQAGFDTHCGSGDHIAPSHSARDLNQDGRTDNILSHWEGGSGWSSTCTCVLDGAHQALSCGTWHNTVYASFSGWEQLLLPAIKPSTGLAQAGPWQDCEALDLSRPTQSGLRLLAPDAAEAPLKWHAGPPLEQAAVCMPPAQATFHGAMSWEPSGEAELKGQWQVVYRPGPGTSLGSSEPKLWATSADGQTQVLGIGHALVLYNATAKRHAWVLNVEGLVPEDHKVDRWTSVESVEMTEESLLVQVRGRPSPSVVDIRLPALGVSGQGL